jgi:hypothetical protein
MKRREFVEKASLGAAALALASQAGSRVSAKSGRHQGHGPISGPLATATVSFGAWASGIDRFPNKGAAPQLPVNVHALIPNEVKIKAGGSVNFVIAGFHLVIVYGDGTKPTDINTSLTNLPTNAAQPPLINDPNNRIYRGIDPTVVPLLRGPQQQGPVGPPFQPELQDRVEVVHFPDPGTFLVICGVLPHFRDDMFGYVNVIP